jgi:hypothetical protein
MAVGAASVEALCASADTALAAISHNGVQFKVTDVA